MHAASHSAIEGGPQIERKRDPATELYKSVLNRCEELNIGDNDLKQLLSVEDLEELSPLHGEKFPWANLIYHLFSNSAPDVSRRAFELLKKDIESKLNKIKDSSAIPYLRDRIKELVARYWPNEGTDGNLTEGSEQVTGTIEIPSVIADTAEIQDGDTLLVREVDSEKLARQIGIKMGSLFIDLNDQIGTSLSDHEYRPTKTMPIDDGRIVDGSVIAGKALKVRIIQN